MTHDKCNVNQSEVIYIICTTDLHVVTCQLYVNQWVTDILCTDMSTTHEGMLC